MIFIVTAGYICSFGGFRNLVSSMYPTLGYMGSLLLLILLVSWLKNHHKIIEEKFLRRKMIGLRLKKQDENRVFTDKDQKLFEQLSEQSVADTETLKRDVKEYADHMIKKEKISG